MTAWADYSYYITEYLAGCEPTVSEADFRSYAVHATAIARRYTGDSISEDDIPEAARYAVCALTEALCAYKSQQNNGVTSEKTGDLAITYESSASRKAAFDKQTLDILATWLSDGGYLYLGVCDHGGVRNC